MEAIIYVLIFIIGTLFGSFYTLAVHRIPKRQDILYTHSYCPNCNHKLGFLDLFPIISYIALGGKCRYCKEKIKPRYLIIEILSGILFVIFALTLNIKFTTLNFANISQYIFMILYITFIILMCGIDKTNKRIDKAVNIYGIVISIIYMIYLCIVENANIYRYAIYIAAYIIIIILDTVTLAEQAKSMYADGILLAIVTMAVFTGEHITICAIILSLLAIAVHLIIYKLKNRTKEKEMVKQESGKICIGFYLGVANMLVVTIASLYTQYLA